MHAELRRYSSIGPLAQFPVSMNFWKERSTVWWRSLAERDPYYAVLTEDRWRGMQSGSGDADVFFERGELFISRVLRDAQTRGFEIKTGGSAVEFGCGVGRLLLPLARRFQTVTGIDVSSAMIREAKVNVELAGLKNVNFVASSGAVPDWNRPLTSCCQRLSFSTSPVVAASG